MEILAERMKLLRQDAKLKQVDAAKALGISISAYCRYEYGQRKPMPPPSRPWRGCTMCRRTICWDLVTNGEIKNEYPSYTNERIAKDFRFFPRSSRERTQYCHTYIL